MMSALRNARDERNWMVPGENTKRKRVYDMLVAGAAPRKIMAELNLSRPAFIDHWYYIKHWAAANACNLAKRRS